MRKFPRILFFIAATMPTAEDFDAADEMGPNVSFRNASMVSTEGALENCDGVAGQVPQRYADKFLSAREAIEAWQTVEMKRRADRAAGKAEEAEPEPVKPAAPAKVQGAGKPVPKPNAATWQANGPTA